MNPYCSPDPCPTFLPATCVFYTGEQLLYLGVNTNDNLQLIIQKINDAFASSGIGYGFNNGVTQPTPSSPVQLGGALIQNTTIGGNFTLEFTGNLQAAKHITTGGTSSQFVKGDGTLDSGPYQPGGNYITSLTGDGTASGPGAAALTLATVNSNPGTYGAGSTIPVVTVNAKGLVTNLTTTALVVPPQPLTFVGDVVGSGFTGSPITLLLQNVNANPYATITPLKITVNTKGLITSASPITASDIINILGYIPGTVSSVGLTMPAAFNIANSPITGSGTINVTAAGTSSQYIAGDGSLVSLPITTSGTAGTSGTSGSSGTSGTSGSTGTSGSSGTTGTSGSSGTTGTSGSSGTSGTTGTSGSSGTSGTTGTSGTSGLSGDRFKTTSTTTYTLQAPGNPGTITVDPGLAYTVAQSIIIAYDPTNYNEAEVTSYDSGTGVLNFTTFTLVGSGTYSSWAVNIDGASGGDGTSGTSGTTGTSGSSGTSGTTGTSGSSGTSGTTGTSGSSGTSGTSATDGTGGTSGTSGTSSTSGTSGTSGLTGTSGTSGVNGTSGINGTSGTSGTSGAAGVNGTNGTSGTSGTSGSSGTSPGLGSLVMVAGTGTGSVKRNSMFMTASGSYSGALSGNFNSASGCSSVVSGGRCNYACSNYSGIGSGYCNNITRSERSVISGGFCNRILTYSPFTSCNHSILGGYLNTIRSNNSFGLNGSTILGGVNNTINCSNTASVGGNYNRICYSGYSVISGGGNNVICASGPFQSASNGIFTGSSNYIQGYSYESFIGGGFSSCITSACRSSIVSGYRNQIVRSCESVISGGRYNTIIKSPTVYSPQHNNSIVGGRYNLLNASSTSSIVSGRCNNIRRSCYSFIASGQLNQIYGALGYYPSYNIILGGCYNKVSSSSSTYSTIINGCCNNIAGASSIHNSILGGRNNTILTSSHSSILSSGYNNTINPYSSNSAIVGGKFNTIGGTNNSFVIGSYLYNGAANTTCVFYLSKLGGTFRIPHPDPAKTNTTDLVHSFVESPTRGDNIYRFTVRTTSCEASLKLPDYYKHLNEDSQVFVSPKDNLGKAYGKIDELSENVSIKSDTEGDFNVLVIGTRKDRHAKGMWKGVEVNNQNIV